VLRRWIDDDQAQWHVIRRQLRFIGITARRKTSPNTWRWQQHADFAGELPAAAIRNVSMDGRLWSYFGDYQPKAAASFRRHAWSDPDVTDPRRDERTRFALQLALRR